MSEGVYYCFRCNHVVLKNKADRCPNCGEPLAL